MTLLDSLKLPDDIKNLDEQQLKQLSEEVREIIIDTTSKTGGHIAPSLGVVELTIALLRRCNPLKDKIVWDVGHQSYAYKILTDRKEKFHTLRQYKGISGFNKPVESPYDAFGVGHTSTSISAGLGIKTAFDLNNEDRKVYVIIGDGAMTGGMAFEALNNLGHLDKNVVVILNDNEMSISPNTGAFSGYLSKLMTGDFYTKFRKDFQNVVENAPLGNTFLTFAKKLEEGLKGFFTPGILFEELGLKYIGPIDGHDLKTLDQVLHNAEIQHGPSLIHIGTKKGKGYLPAEKNPAKFHGVSAFNKATGEAIKFGNAKTYTQIFGETIVELAEKNDKIIAITAAMTDGTGLAEFAEKFPERFFDTGIAEQHSTTFAAGLAISGYKPYFAVYSTFLQRAYDQIIHDVALQNLPVTFCIDRAGLVGADGPTHHGTFDMSYLKCIPNLTIMMPKDGIELKQMLKFSESFETPIAIRYPRGTAFEFENEIKEIKLGEPEIIYKGKEIAIVSAGHIFEESLKLYEMLKNEGYTPTLINLRFLNPLNSEALLNELSDKNLIVTVEENALKGGAGDEILNIVNDNEINAKVKKFGIPHKFIEHGDIKSLREICNLTAEKMFNTVKTECLKKD